MSLIWASLDPASRTAKNRMDSPACQVVGTAARADAESGGNESLIRLAIGSAVAAFSLTKLLATHREKALPEFLDSLDAATPADFPTAKVTPMLRTMLRHDGLQQSARFLADLFGQDQEAFLDLIVELGDYAACCAEMADQLGLGSLEDTMGELDSMLQELTGD